MIRPDITLVIGETYTSINYTVIVIIYHSNVCFSQELHNVNNPVKGEVGQCLNVRSTLNKMFLKIILKPTCLPSLRHWDGEILWSLVADCWSGAGPSCRVGFSILRARRSLIRGRYTVPSRALHRRIPIDRGQPFSLDRTTPAWGNRENGL